MLAQEFYFDFLDLDFSPDPRTLVFLWHIIPSVLYFIFVYVLRQELVQSCKRLGHICIVNPGYLCLVEILGICSSFYAGYTLRTFAHKVMDTGFLNLDRKITHNFFQKLQFCTYLVVEVLNKTDPGQVMHRTPNWVHLDWPGFEMQKPVVKQFVSQSQQGVRIMCNPICLHWSCSPSTCHVAGKRCVTTWGGATQKQAKWIKLDLSQTIEKLAKCSSPILDLHWTYTFIQMRRYFKLVISKLSHRIWYLRVDSVQCTFASRPIGCVASTFTFGLGCGHFGIRSTVELCRFCVLSLHREVGGVRQYTR